MNKIIPNFFSALSEYASKVKRSDRYTYIPLNENAWEIRLLTLLPDKFSAKIRIHLDIKALDPSSNDQPCYEALSYTWGSLKNPSEILVEDPDGAEKQKVIQVTQNLVVALRHLRDEHEPRRFWIDAICVDQQNLSERSAQVQRMGDIFRRADRVVAWLGAEENESSLAMSLLLNLSSKIVIDKITRAIFPSAEGAAEPHWANRMEKLPYDERESTAIYKLLYRPWFERIWIQQEIRLANSSKAIIKCGFRQMLWSSFWSAILCLNVKPSLSTSAMGNHLDFNERIILIGDLEDEVVTTSFLLLLYSTRKCKCSDPRDRIYALLHLSPYFKNKLVPDYNKPVQTVYQDLIRCYLEICFDSSILISCEMHKDLPFKQSWISDFSHRNLAVLGLVNARRELEGLPLAPSWVPSWSNGDFPEPFRFSWTSGHSAAEAEFIEPSILKVAGVLVAVVKDTQEISLPAQDMPHCFFKTINQLYQHATLNLKAESFDTAEQFYDTFCRTLAGNGFADTFHPPMKILPNLQESKKLC